MPTVLIKEGFRIFFYSADGNEPIHVHIEYGDAMAKFWMNPISLESSYRMKAKDLKKARTILEDNSELIRREWNEYFGIKNL